MPCTVNPASDCLFLTASSYLHKFGSSIKHTWALLVWICVPYYFFRLWFAASVSIWQVEVSLQPWEAFRPDGVILFSDILTPLSGMNIPFDIAGGEGPIIHNPIRTLEVGAVQNHHLFQNALWHMRSL